jgi:K(+)-stimulated pyrophosphate-energized sodium pump
LFGILFLKFVKESLLCVTVTLTLGTYMTELFYLPPVLGFAGLLTAFVIYLIIKKAPVSNPAIIKIGGAIHSGAMVFMHREYKMLFLFALVVGVALYFSLGQHTTIAFVTGAICSAFAGYMGMFTATKANVRTTQAAHDEGPAAALTIAFMGL